MNKEEKIKNKLFIFIVGIILAIGAILPLTGCDAAFYVPTQRVIIRSRGHSRPTIRSHRRYRRPSVYRRHDGRSRRYGGRRHR